MKATKQYMLTGLPARQKHDRQTLLIPPENQREKKKVQRMKVKKKGKLVNAAVTARH
jgi:hypothetical protein